MNKTVSITPNLEIGGEKLTLIAGPCQIESLDHSLKIADFLRRLSSKLGINLIFKSSFDKANRTSLNSQRGPGLEQGIEILSAVKKQLEVPLLTDIHESWQAAPTAEVVDILQIPAFLCRQSDLLIAAGKTGRTINIKKGQFLPAQDLKYSAEKVCSTGNSKVLLCERGNVFGYRELIVDFRNLVTLKQLGFPVVFDATHSVQVMGGNAGSSGGNRDYVGYLAQAASAVGIDALFLECHEAPDSAPSDGPNMLQLEALEPLLTRILRIREVLRETL